MAAPHRAAPEHLGPLRNRLLSALPAAELARFTPALERICMESRQLAFDVDVPIQHVYFPEDCVMSVVAVMTDGSAVETGSVGRDEFPLTQRVLSQMLGVRRATVTEAARSLQQAGLITYVHGRVTVRERRGLERVSCECYAIIRREFERLLDGRKQPSPLDGVRVSEAGRSIVGDGTAR